MMKYILLVAILILPGCMPDSFRSVDGSETFCYLCFGYYQMIGEKELVVDAPDEAIKEAIKNKREKTKLN